MTIKPLFDWHGAFVREVESDVSRVLIPELPVNVWELGDDELVPPFTVREFELRRYMVDGASFEVYVERTPPGESDPAALAGWKFR